MGRLEDHMDYMRSRRTYVRETPLVRLMRRVVVNEITGCWEFQGVSRPDGYGAVGTGGRGPKILAHRLTYEQYVGPIPDGYEIHHRCHVPACCNPAHLEQLSSAEHRARHHQKQEQCGRGHSDWLVKRNGDRNCRVCHRERERARQQRVRALARGFSD